MQPSSAIQERKRERSPIARLSLVAAVLVLSAAAGLAVRYYRPPSAEVAALVETAPVPHAGDAADDAAVWVDRSEPAGSLIVGTDKKGGLSVYDLSGAELQRFD